MARNRAATEELGITISEELLFSHREHRARLQLRRERLGALMGAAVLASPAFRPLFRMLEDEVRYDEVLTENTLDLVAALATSRFGWTHGLPEVRIGAEKALARVNERYRQLHLAGAADPVMERVG